MNIARRAPHNVRRRYGSSERKSYNHWGRSRGMPGFSHSRAHTDEARLCRNMLMSFNHAAEAYYWWESHSFA